MYLTMLTLQTNHFSTPLSISEWWQRESFYITCSTCKKVKFLGCVPRDSDPVGLGICSVLGISGDLNMDPAVGLDLVGPAELLKQ